MTAAGLEFRAGALESTLPAPVEFQLPTEAWRRI